MKGRDLFYGLEKAYIFNKEILWQVPRMYDVGSKLLNGIKSMYVNNLAHVSLKRGKRERFRIGSGVRQGCMISC